MIHRHSCCSRKSMSTLRFKITTACWGILGVDPNDMMCASSRMVVKHKGDAVPAVMACTLLAYESNFNLGRSLADANAPVALNHLAAQHSVSWVEVPATTDLACPSYRRRTFSHAVCASVNASSDVITAPANDWRISGGVSVNGRCNNSPINRRAFAMAP